MASRNENTFVFASDNCFDGLNLHEGIDPTDVDDVRLKRGEVTLITTYPRTGTTWLSQIVSLLLAGESGYEKAKATKLIERVLFAEYIDDGKEEQLVHTLHGVPKPCALKSHLPYRCIKRWIDEDKVKTIITTRNPKDTLVSFYHFYKTIERIHFDGTWNEFFEHVKAGNQLYGDQLEWYMDWQDYTDDPDVLLIKYEDTKADVEGVIYSIIKFLGLSVSDELVKRIVKDSHITSMAADPKINLKDNAVIKPGSSFIRKGESGTWKKYFTVEQNEWFDRKYKEGYKNCPLDVDFD